MAKIKIDADGLKANAAALDTRISDLQNLITKLEDLIARIQGSWEGQASIMYIAKLLAQSAKAKKMVEVLQEYKKYVEKALSKFTELDSGSANKINSSF